MVSPSTTLANSTVAVVTANRKANGMSSLRMSRPPTARSSLASTPTLATPQLLLAHVPRASKPSARSSRATAPERSRRRLVLDLAMLANSPTPFPSAKSEIIVPFFHIFFVNIVQFCKEHSHFTSFGRFPPSGKFDKD